MTRPTRQYQKFPIYYPGEAPFVNDNNVEATPAGASASITINITTRPMAWVGLFIRNIYDVPNDGVVFGPEGEEQRFYPPQLVDYCERLDGEQDITVELAQQNVVVRPAAQVLIQGARWIHLHPFPTPFLFRGGNNIVVNVRRRTAYPDDFGIVNVQAVAKGWQYVNDADPGGHPPSTDFPTG